MLGNNLESGRKPTKLKREAVKQISPSEMLPLDYTALWMEAKIILIMNKLKIYGIILLLFIANLSYATIDPPANADESDPGHPEYNVVNTGNDMITYEFQGSSYKMKITVADGDDPHIVSKLEDGSGNHKLDVSSYGKGVYILRLNRMSDVQTQRIVIY